MKEIKKLLLSKPFLVPQEFPDKSEFRHHIIAKLDAFKFEVEQVIIVYNKSLNSYQKKINETVLEALKNSILSIKTVLNLYYNGFPDKAYQEFVILMNRLNGKKLIPLNYTIWNSTNFYRVRASSIPLVERKELFHIPLNERTKIKTQRYSIAGYPCLYLSNSPYVCWAECDKPTISECYFSLFKLINPLTFLDLRISNFYEEINKKEMDWKKAVMSFPLFFITNIKVKKPNDPFKPEYILAQFATRWCKELTNGLDGVLYNSTKLDYDKTSGEFINLSMPVLYEHKDFEISPSFCDELARNIKMSQPFCKKQLDKGTFSTKIKSVIKYIPNKLSKKEEYSKSFFYKTEVFLNNQTIDIIELV